jgi:hypothetical protein
LVEVEELEGAEVLVVELLDVALRTTFTSTAAAAGGGGLLNKKGEETMDEAGRNLSEPE